MDIGFSVEIRNRLGFPPRAPRTSPFPSRAAHAFARLIVAGWFARRALRTLPRCSPVAPRLARNVPGLFHILSAATVTTAFRCICAPSFARSQRLPRLVGQIPQSAARFFAAGRAPPLFSPPRQAIVLRTRSHIRSSVTLVVLRRPLHLSRTVLAQLPLGACHFFGSFPQAGIGFGRRFPHLH